MKKIIAVEEGLSSVVRDTMTREGYELVKPGAGSKVDATIITGMDMNVMGMQDIANKQPVIDARGKTADQILSDLKSRL
ncbi:YkuS family protein [Pelotomaculum propionicicum]|uniref:YkuS family protein n=1 Tax=Pelotomaculum propionicicum TaxID=258475 RepID=UPI003B8170EC